MDHPRSGIRLWLLAFTGFFLLHAAWAVAAPYDGPPDEQAHALRAAAVGHGELLASDDSMQLTPRSLSRNNCFPQHVEIPADCALPPGGDETMQRHIVGAASYNPVYYAVLGWPAAVWPDWTGVILTRLLTGAAMAALLASAVVAAVHWIQRRAVLAGVLVAATPMVAHLGGAINPNGVEIAAGVALFTGLITVFLEPGERLNHRAVALVGISASVLVTPRPLGLIWLGLIVLTVLIGSSLARLRALARERVVRIWTGVIVGSTVASLAWNFVATPLSVVSGDQGLTSKEVLRFASLDVWPNVANQMVGVMGWSEVLQPRLVYVAWFASVGLLVLGGFALGGRADKLRLVFLFCGTFFPLLTWELLRANDSGWFNQGRYFLPGAVGLPILGAYALARSGVGAAQFRSLTRTLAVVLLPIHLVCLAYTMTRWQSGLTILNPLKGSWMPPLGPEVPLVAAVVGLLVLLVTYWWGSRLPDVSAEAAAEPSARVASRAEDLAAVS